MRTRTQSHNVGVMLGIVLFVGCFALLMVFANIASAQMSGMCAPPTNRIYEQNGQQYLETSYPSCGQMGSAKYVQPYYGQAFSTSSYIPATVALPSSGQVSACGQPTSHTYNQNGQTFIETAYPQCGDVGPSKFVEPYYGQLFASTGQVPFNTQTPAGQVLGQQTTSQQVAVGQRYGANGQIYGPTTQETWGRITRETAITRMPLCEITQPLAIGVRSDEVRCLQQFLNWAGYTVSATGPGSRGLETDYYGPLTAAAVARWQSANSPYVMSPGLTSDNNRWGYMSSTRYVSIARSYLGL